MRRSPERSGTSPALPGRSRRRGRSAACEIGERRLRPDEVIVALRKPALQHLQAGLHLGDGVRHDIFVRRDAELREHVPLVRHVIDHVRVAIAVDRADPLVHARPLLRVVGRQSRRRDDDMRLAQRVEDLVLRRAMLSSPRRPNATIRISPLPKTAAGKRGGSPSQLTLPVPYSAGISVPSSLFQWLRWASPSFLNSPDLSHRG